MDPFAIIADRIAPGAALTRQWPLEGGVSARVDALELTLPDGTTRRVVVRRHGAAEWKPLDADVTATEFALLEVLHHAGMAVPAPCFVDLSRAVLPSPYLVMALVDGTTTVDQDMLPDALRQMANYLARLHALDLDGLELPALPRCDDPIAETLRYLPAITDSDRLRAALSAHQPGSAPNASVLVHGDFWPGNILWQDGTIAAVIDWEDAAIGDPLADLAGCRIELLWKYGEDAMETFTAHYLALADVDPVDLPLWELLASSGAAAFMAQWGLDPRVEAKMRRQAMQFMERAGRQVLARNR